MQWTYSSDLQETRVSTGFMSKVYNWMFAALLISWGTAYYVATTPTILVAVMSLFTPIIIIELLFVFALSFFINKISAPVAMLLFIAYSILNWLTLSVIFLAYSMSAIILAFGITAWTFFFMAMYWYFTKSDLSTFGTVMVMWLFGLILATIVNIFLQSALFDYILSWAWVIIFTWLTAYDNQKIKEMWEAGFANWETETKMSIMWALTLYLDFINLFLYIIKLFWSRD